MRTKRFSENPLTKHDVCAKGTQSVLTIEGPQYFPSLSVNFGGPSISSSQSCVFKIVTYTFRAYQWSLMTSFSTCDHHKHSALLRLTIIRLYLLGASVVG